MLHIWLLAISVLGSVKASDPTFCTKHKTVRYRCHCYRCCHKCDCHVRGDFWHHCNGCNQCWCSPGCKCCGRNCCDNCCSTCSRVECSETISYHVHDIRPTFGPVTGRTMVSVNGGVYTNIDTIKCKFGTKEVAATYISPTEIKCAAPAQDGTVRDVPLEISLDNGAHWTSNGINYKYYNCPGGGECSGHGTCHPDSTCTCKKGYFGPGCESECPGGASSPCMGHTESGTCNSMGNCTCQIGYYGDMCEFQCPGGVSNPCNLHGKCLSNGQCQCDHGWVGFNCTREGTCNGTMGTDCDCRNGFWGPRCTKDCDGGHTINCNAPQGICGKDGHCYCASGYWGHTCENECPGGAANPCSGHGEMRSCSKVGVCHCQAGWWGVTCGNECPGGASNPCNGRGSCSANGHCMCQKGYAGSKCELVCPGGVSNPCSGRGTCDLETGTCACNSTRFFGEACESICDCSGNGVCSVDGTCTCFHGYFGEKCEKFCHSAPGQGPCGTGVPGEPAHGTCAADAKCSCNPGWWGEACENECPGGYATPCNGNGICNITGGCECNPSWAGDSCQDEKCPYNCHGNGVCEAGKCLCSPGFDSPYCSPHHDGPAAANKSREHGVIGFLQTSVFVQEFVESVTLTIVRAVGTKNVSATVTFKDISTLKGFDYWGSNGQSFYWQDGDNSSRNISLTIIQDAEPEPDESFMVILDPISGGAIGGNTSAMVTILANNETKTALAVEIKFRLTKKIDEIPDRSKERAEFENQFIDDIAGLLNIPRRRIEVEFIVISPELVGTQIQILILPENAEDTPDKNQMQKLTAALLDYAKNTTGPLYKGIATRSIDYRYAPEVIQSPVPPTSYPTAEPTNNGNPDHHNNDKDTTLSNGQIAGIIAGALIGVLFCGLMGYFCYVKRIVVVEYLLWKLGNFRFRSLREEEMKSRKKGENGDVHMQLDDEEDISAGDIVGDEIVGGEAPDFMPRPDDF